MSGKSECSGLRKLRISTQTVLCFLMKQVGDLFIGYIENFLAPTLKEGDILVVLDSASAHKKYELDAVYEQGADVWFLPRYSPDFNPCEPSWSKAKSTLRKLKARTEETLTEAMVV